MINGLQDLGHEDFIAVVQGRVIIAIALQRRQRKAG
jgi:hypothetical protein